MPGLDHIRSQSLFELSDVKCYFKWGTDYWAARQEVINRLQFVQLPGGIPGAALAVERDRRGVSLHAEGQGLHAQRAEDRRGLDHGAPVRQVPGVIDVTSYGGETKQYHVEVDPYRLRGHGVTLPQVQQAIQNANQNVGGERLTIGEQSYDIRGIGLVHDVHDIENIVVAEQKGIPVRVRDVADVDIGHAPRLGIVGHDDEPDVVQGIVLMRYGGETPRDARRDLRARRLHPEVPPPAAGDGHRPVLRPRRRSCT